MFNIGDKIVYSLHGLCQIDDICEKTYSQVPETYYVLHPLGQSDLTIITPVNNDKVLMLKMMDREEAEEILQSFKQPGIKWIEESRERIIKFNEVIKTGNRKEIAKIANTLMGKIIELSKQHKKPYEQDKKLLKTIQDLMFEELAMALNSSFEKIKNQVTHMVNEQFMELY